MGNQGARSPPAPFHVFLSHSQGTRRLGIAFRIEVSHGKQSADIIVLRGSIPSPPDRQILIPLIQLPGDEGSPPSGYCLPRLRGFIPTRASVRKSLSNPLPAQSWALILGRPPVSSFLICRAIKVIRNRQRGCEWFRPSSGGETARANENPGLGHR